MVCPQSPSRSLLVLDSFGFETLAQTPRLRKPEPEVAGSHRRKQEGAQGSMQLIREQQAGSTVRLFRKLILSSQFSAGA